MKTVLFCTLFALIGCMGHSQVPAAVETEYKMPAGKKAVLKLPFGGNIVVKTWNQPTLKFHSIITTDREEYKQMHQVKVEDKSDKLFIETDYAKTFNGEKINCFSCDTTNNRGTTRWGNDENRKCICLHADYEITLPEGTSLEIETISGNIEIKGHNGDIKAKTSSGFVDIDRPSVSAVNLDMHSVTGEIYTDFDIALKDDSSEFNKQVDTTTGNGGRLLSLETISGNIYFRKR